MSWLGGRAVDVWLVDFGRPEDAEHGLERTLDDHVLAVDACIDHVREATGQDVHVAGYSQGGMFVYQVAAYRRTEGIASLVTFGSPVDIHRNVPAMHDAVAGRLLKGVRTAVKRPLQKIDGLPGALTSTGFKVLSARKEVQQYYDLFTVLHDREELQKREQRRRFLAERGSSRGRDLRSRLCRPVRCSQPDEGRRVRDRGPDRDAGGHPLPAALLRRDPRRDRSACIVRAIRTEAPGADLHELSVRAGALRARRRLDLAARVWPRSWSGCAGSTAMAPCRRGWRSSSQSRSRTSRRQRLTTSSSGLRRSTTWRRARSSSSGGASAQSR